VDRKIWLRGNQSDIVLLRASDGKRCCVGFFAEQVLGIPDSKLLEETTLSGVCDNYASPRAAVLLSALELAFENGDIYITNDKPSLTPAQRESKLTQLFKRLGYHIKFVG
jgi:hypothetical protein